MQGLFQLSRAIYASFGHIPGFLALTIHAVFRQNRQSPMKLLLSLSLITILASCTGFRSADCSSMSGVPRYTSELPCRVAPATNEGLCYVSSAGGQVVKSGIDLVDDSTDYVGIVADKQARTYTNIGMTAIRRTDDIVYRETTRYLDYGLDTVDDGASYAGSAINRWPHVATGAVQRTLGSTRRIYQSTLASYGEAVNRTYWPFWNIFTPPEPKPYMVGRLNDLHPGYAMPGSGWHCRLPQIPVEPVQETAAKNPKNPLTASK
jgi:hypothetical protein